MATQTTKIEQEIRRADDDFETSFARGDAAGMASLYTGDGMLLPTGSDFITGTQAIQQYWQGAMDMGVKQAKLDIVEVEQQGDTATEVGKYTLRGEGGQVIDQGKYIVLWRQQNGQWKLHRDIWNSSMSQPS